MLFHRLKRGLIGDLWGEPGDTIEITQEDLARKLLREGVISATPPDPSVLTPSAEPATETPASGTGIPVAQLNLPPKQTEALIVAGLLTVDQVTPEALAELPGLTKAVKLSISAAVEALTSAA